MNPFRFNRCLRQFEESDNIKVFAKAGDMVESDVSIETRVSYNLQICFMNESLADNDCLFV